MPDADGFVGGVMAVEGITDATVTLHGQRGCRKGLLLSETCCPRPDRDRLVDVPYYNGNRTVPFSCMTFSDYNGGSFEKLKRAVRYVLNEDYALNVILCSPGVSIIGDDCERANDECGCDTMVCDRDSLTGDRPGGFDRMIANILDNLGTEKNKTIPNSVNILGLSIMHADWRSVKQELTDVLEDAGIQVICTPGAGCTVSQLAESVEAQYNIVLCPEHCQRTSALYRLHYGTAEINTGSTPIGFEATKNLYDAIGQAFGRKLDFGMTILNRARRRAYENITALGKTMVGVTFSIKAPRSEADALSEWLQKSLGMVPAEGRPEVLFAPGDDVTVALANGECDNGVDIGFPSTNRMDFSRRPVMGVDGALYILDSLFK